MRRAEVYAGFPLQSPPNDSERRGGSNVFNSEACKVKDPEDAFERR